MSKENRTVKSWMSCGWLINFKVIFITLKTGLFCSGVKRENSSNSNDKLLHGRCGDCGFDSEHKQAFSLDASYSKASVAVLNANHVYKVKEAASNLTERFVGMWCCLMSTKVACIYCRVRVVGFCFPPPPFSRPEKAACIVACCMKLCVWGTRGFFFPPMCQYLEKSWCTLCLMLAIDFCEILWHQEN